MSDGLHRLVYYSRNTLSGSEQAIALEIQQVLASSRRNNAADGITGALMFNRGCFAQVLEGPRPALERTFERIQRDMRHEDVLLLQFGHIQSLLHNPKSCPRTSTYSVPHPEGRYILMQGSFRSNSAKALQERGFPDWSMAFIGQSAEGSRLHEGIAGQSGFVPARLTGDRIVQLLRELVLEEEGLAAIA